MKSKRLYGPTVLAASVLCISALAVVPFVRKGHPRLADNPAGVLNPQIPSEIPTNTIKSPETTTSLTVIPAPETSVPVRPQQADRPIAPQPSRSAPITLEETPGGFDPSVRTVNSTAYCLSGHMANGKNTHEGAVAMNGVPLESRWQVIETGVTYTVEDRIGSGSQFDIWMSSCAAADQYGRQAVHIVEVTE